MKKSRLMMIGNPTWTMIFNMVKRRKNTMQIKMGCDPELFVVNKDGMPRSAHGLVPGTKETPHKCKKGAYQVDGMALEFNIDPATTEDEWVDNITTVMQELRKATPSEYKFLVAPSVRFHHLILKKAPDEAKELGCMPDYSAYTMKENPKPNAATTLRTASGHVHIGFGEGFDIASEEHFVRCATLVKHLDLFLGVRSLEWDTDQKRRALYGDPGAMRIKPYGVEYRVLSNQWLNKEALVRFVYNQTLRCIEDLKTNGALEKADYDKIAKDIKSGRRYYSQPRAASFYFGRVSKKAQAAIAAADELKIG
jgi:hypothetical protein